MSARGAYLLLYNFGLCIAWGYLFYQVAIQYDVETGFTKRTLTELYAQLARPLQVIQTAAVMEIIHSAVGLVRSPVFTTVAQVSSRLWLVWGILDLLPHVASQSLHLLTLHPALAPIAAALPFAPVLNFATLLTAWCLSEIIRYGFFAMQELGGAPYFMLWLRYTAFYVLYPLGVGSELALAYMALPTIQRRKLWSYEMPNAINFAFDYHVACIVLMGVYAPGFYMLYTYMIGQRGKKLSAGAGGVKRKAD